MIQDMRMVWDGMNMKIMNMFLESIKYGKLMSGLWFRLVLQMRLYAGQPGKRQSTWGKGVKLTCKRHLKKCERITAPLTNLPLQSDTFFKTSVPPL
jgi:hypothetical protein